MKKILLLVLSVFYLQLSMAQPTAISESFETWPAPDWNNYQYENAGWVHSIIFGGNLGYGGGNCAKHKIANAGVDDWLVSPQVNIAGSNYELNFYEQCTDLVYYTYAGIFISTGSGDPADGDFIELEESLQVEGSWTLHTIDLSAYNGEQIYIAFVFQGSSSNWMHWDVDEVAVAPSTFIDGGLTEIVNPTGINPIPGAEDVIVKLHNYGTDAIVNAEFEWTINGVDQPAFQANGINLSPGDETYINLGSYDFNTEGDYEIYVHLVYSGDMNAANDEISGMYFVSDPKDAHLIEITPFGYLPTAGLRDVVATVENTGEFSFDEFIVEWSVNGVDQSDFQVTNANLNPGESTEVLIGQFNFSEGLSELSATINLSADEDLSNNTNQSDVAVNILWESFEGSIFPPELWTAENYPLKDYFFPEPDGDFYYVAATDNNMFGTISDTLYTPLLQIENGDEFTFWVSNSAYFTNDDKLIWKDGTTGAVHLIGDIDSQLEAWDEVTMDISSAVGVNYIGIVNNHGGSFGTSSYDLISSTAVVYLHNEDLGVKNFEFDYMAHQNEIHNFSVLVKNYGNNTINSSEYSIKLMNSNGDLLVEENGVDILSWEEITFELEHTFSSIETTDLYVLIDFTSDQATENNQSVIKPIIVTPMGTELLDIGTPDIENAMIPFNTGGDTWTLGQDDISQHIYYETEVEAGYIHGITLYYHELHGVEQTLPLEVGIMVTDLENLSEGWISQSEFTTVFNDTIEVVPGFNSVFIPFDEPFLYTGIDNLAIQYYQYNPSWPYTACRFFSTTVEDGPVRSIRLNDVYNLELNNLPDYWAEHIDFPYTTFMIQAFEEEGIISGIVYDENNVGIADANLQIDGTNIIVSTNSNGEYSLPSLPFDEYTITATALGYFDESQSIALDLPNETLDFNMSLLPLVNITGIVTGSNAPSIPLEGASAKIDGYASSLTFTNADGEFILENIYGYKNYNLTIQLYGYEIYIDEIIVEDENLDLGTIILNEEFISAYNVQVTAGNTTAYVEWLAPITSQKEKMQNDLGASSFSFTNEPYEDVYLGNYFENNDEITITSIEVLWDIYENAHDFVTIEIFDENANSLVKSLSFQTYHDSLMTIDIPNIFVNGGFYAMVHWMDNAESTDPLTIDFTEGIENTAYIMYPGNDPILLSDYIGSEPGAFIIRANTLSESGGKSQKEALSYNVYKGLSEEINQSYNWTQINTDPITELVYIDETWGANDPGIYSYAIEAIYTEDVAEFSFSNFAEIITGIDFVENTNIQVFPNPAKRYISITGLSEYRLLIFNIHGKLVDEKYIQQENAQINLQHLNAGEYLLRFEENNRITVKKLLIAK